jgi:hypothetical protein
LRCWAWEPTLTAKNKRKTSSLGKRIRANIMLLREPPDEAQKMAVKC